MKAVRINEFGDASVLRIEDVAAPRPQTDEVLVRVIASPSGRPPGSAGEAVTV